MQFLIYAMIFFSTVIENLTERHAYFPKLVQLLPEGLTAVVILVVVAMGARQRFRFVRPEYLFVFAAITMVMVASIISNAVAPGVIFTGIRSYIRAIPLFILPAVYEFSEQQVRRQFKFLLFMAMIQLPFAVYQRMTVLEEERWTGDGVVGTLADSSFLSMYLIGAVCILTGMFLRKRINVWVYFGLFFYLLAATSINETKGTVILVPIALLVSAVVGSPPARRMRVVLLSTAMLAIFGTGFVAVYDYVQRFNPEAHGIVDFFTDSKKLEHYVDTNGGLGVRRQVGRIDAIVTPLAHLSKDPVQLALGVGIGNSSNSSLGPLFTGRYYPLFQHFLINSLSVFLIEIGVLGTFLVFCLYYLIFQDTLAVAKADDSLLGSIAIGWAGITLMIAISMPYKTMHISVFMSYVFWYVSGLIAARRLRLAAQLSEQSHTLRSPALGQARSIPAPAARGARYSR